MDWPLAVAGIVVIVATAALALLLTVPLWGRRGRKEDRARRDE